VCYKYGALWAYFPVKDVKIDVAADGANTVTAYMRDDEAAPKTATFNHCSHCGCMTNWFGVLGQEKIGVNCRMLPEKETQGIEREVRYR